MPSFEQEQQVNNNNEILSLALKYILLKLYESIYLAEIKIKNNDSHSKIKWMNNLFLQELSKGAICMSTIKHIN